MNFKKDGTPFLNQLFMCPLEYSTGELAFFVGVQTSVRTLSSHQDEAKISVDNLLHMRRGRHSVNSLDLDHLAVIEIKEHEDLCPINT